MRTAVALLGVLGTAAAGSTPTTSPSEVCRCPNHSAIADVYLNHPSGSPAAPLHEASDPNTGVVHGAPWTWIPQDGVKLQPFPAELDTLRCGNYYGYQCRRVENGTVFKVSCKTAVCDVYVFLYHEPPRSSNTNGRLPLTLPPDWETGSCAPSFCIEQAGTDTGNQCCRMTAFRRQVNRSAMVNFTIDELLGTMDAYYLLLAVAPGELCDNNVRSLGQEPCEAQSPCANALCRWEADADAAKEDSNPLVRSAAVTGLASAGRCVPNWCPRVRDARVTMPVCDAPLTEPACSVTSDPTKSPTAPPMTSDPTKSPTTPPMTSDPTKSPTAPPTTSDPTKNPTAPPTTSDPTGGPTRLTEPPEAPWTFPPFAFPSPPTRNPTPGR